MKQITITIIFPTIFALLLLKFSSEYTIKAGFTFVLILLSMILWELIQLNSKK